MTEPTDAQLLDMVVAADDEALSEGEVPQQRVFSVISKVMTKLGYASFVMAGQPRDPLVDRIAALHSALYRKSDLAVGGIHGGIYMFRDVFARIDVPLIYGHVSIDPFKMTNLTPNQLRWLGQRPDDVCVFLDQFTDIFDFAGGIGNLADFKRPPKDALGTFWLAAFQLQAAAAALSVAFDSRGAVQSALIGAELALKAGLAAVGKTAKEIKDHGHNLTTAADDYFKLKPEFDIQRVRSVIGRMPPYVKNRYSAQQPSRVETGHIVMGAQYLAGEVMRQLTGFSCRSASTQPTQRRYPPV